MSPELLDATVSSPTTKCDVYSFGMTMLECFTLEEPFSEIKREIHVITKMSKGPLTPMRPETADGVKWITDEVWTLMMDCWDRSAENRPDMATVAQRMREIEIHVRLAASSSSSSVIQMPTPVLPLPLSSTPDAMTPTTMPGTPQPPEPAS